MPSFWSKITAIGASCHWVTISKLRIEKKLNNLIVERFMREGTDPAEAKKSAVLTNGDRSESK